MSDSQNALTAIEAMDTPPEEQQQETQEDNK